MDEGIRHQNLNHFCTIFFCSMRLQRWIEDCKSFYDSSTWLFPPHINDIWIKVAQFFLLIWKVSCMFLHVWAWLFDDNNWTLLLVEGKTWNKIYQFLDHAFFLNIKIHLSVIMQNNMEHPSNPEAKRREYNRIHCS